MIERVIIIVLDGVGAGAMPDAGSFGDMGANTLLHTLTKCPDNYFLQNMALLGLYNTREIVPLLVYSKNANCGVNLGVRKTFADIAKSVCQLFSLVKFPEGESFAGKLFNLEAQ